MDGSDAYLNRGLLRPDGSWPPIRVSGKPRTVAVPPECSNEQCG